MGKNTPSLLHIKTLSKIDWHVSTLIRLPRCFSSPIEVKKQNKTQYISNISNFVNAVLSCGVWGGGGGVGGGWRWILGVGMGGEEGQGVGPSELSATILINEKCLQQRFRQRQPLPPPS